MKFSRLFYLFLLLAASALGAFSLDRDAFTFTHYDLTVRVEPEQQRLAVRGKITLRNDSPTPQKIAVLQISSSLDWRSIRAGDKPLQYVTQPYTSDIDHTGALSEAVVTLPLEIPPHAEITLDVAYEGVVPLDATRLTRIGAPETIAQSSDWDQISTKFTALRGAGYVAWYPIAAQAANLSEENSLFEIATRWKRREAGSTTHLQIVLTNDGGMQSHVIFNGVDCPLTMTESMGASLSRHDCAEQKLRLDAPTLVIADYSVIERPSGKVLFLRGHDASAAQFADVTEKVAPLIADWFGPPREKATIADLPVPDAAPFESGTLLLTPLPDADPKLVGIAATHQLTHASFLSSRPWIEEGLAHFAQALYIEREKGRRSALDYIRTHMALGEPASSTTPRSDDEIANSLINTLRDDLYRGKAMSVWWMLRDVLGDAPLKKALAAYKPEQDRDPSYMPKLIQAQTPRDLEWFFDDWVYRDRGLPDFKIESAFSRKTLNDVYILTVTVVNLGAAGAEVPVMVKYGGGQVEKRLEVRGLNKAVTRVEVSGMPEEVIINDGSVPESDTTNNTYTIEPARVETTEPPK